MILKKELVDIYHVDCSINELIFFVTSGGIFNIREGEEDLLRIVKSINKKNGLSHINTVSSFYMLGRE